MPSKTIHFVTDSTCDIPAELVQRWHITVVPTFVNIGDASYADDGVHLDREDFYEHLATLTPFPTTAAPSPGLAKQAIDSAFDGADHVMIVTAPARLSAIYESMRLGAAHWPQDQVTLFDSGTVSMAMGYQVLVGAEVAEDTGDVEQVIQAMTRVRAHVKLGAMASTLENLRRSGRINLAAAGIGALLQIKPVITVEDGQVIVLSRLRTEKRGRQDLIDRIRAQVPLERLALLHINNREGLTWMRSQLEDIAPERIEEMSANPTLGTHVGPKALGFVTLSEKWRLDAIGTGNSG